MSKDGCSTVNPGQSSGEKVSGMTLSRYLSRRDTSALLDLTHASLCIAGEEYFRELISELAGLIPFDHALCMLAKVNNGFGIKSYDLVNISFPSEWIDRYVSREYHTVDPLAKENFTHYRVQYWPDTFEKYGQSYDFRSSARDFGLIKGYTYGVRNTGEKGGSLFSFSGDAVERHERTEVILKHIIPHLHRYLNHLISMNTMKPLPSLSPRELEVLNWLKLGKTSWAISVILEISERTVNYHVNNIMRKLGVINRLQAVSEAVHQGLTEIE
ncbi:MAG: autoinducer binding domain-containing protein [Nitrospirae bacterium]|nr:autoinducer binding domain-containing protein [Nitrospirota bacterium]